MLPSQLDDDVLENAHGQLPSQVPGRSGVNPELVDYGGLIR